MGEWVESCFNPRWVDFLGVFEHFFNNPPSTVGPILRGGGKFGFLCAQTRESPYLYWPTQFFLIVKFDLIPENLKSAWVSVEYKLTV